MSRPDPLLGSVIAGRYQVLGVIGKGGMGTIYEVKNTRLGRSFALKTLTGGADSEVIARFRREAEIVAKLRHPNILEIVDWETLEDGSPCMVMEYLSGNDLAARLRSSGPLSWPELARIADQVLSALAVAHRAGVVHRDLKPQNIFLATDDNGEERVKLLDFGISKLSDTRTFTTTDAKVMGTPMYMPPEQAEGRQDDIGPATDVWAMGTILYEMATARLAFEAPSVPAILYRVCHGRPIPLAELRPDAPRAFVEALDHTLVRELAGRTASADHLRKELRAALADVPGVSWPEPLRPRTGPVATPAGGVRITTPIATAPTLGVVPPPSTPSAVTAPATVPALATVPAPATVPVPVPRSRRRGLVIGVVGVATVIAAGLAAAIAMRSSHESPPATSQAPAAAPMAAPTPQPMPAPAPAPAKITVAIDSTPPGADVYRLPSEAKVGITPWRSELDRVDGSGVFVLKKTGYTDQRVEIDLRASSERAIALARLPAHAAPPVHPPAATRPNAATPPVPPSRKKGEPVDPFAKGSAP